MKEMQRYIILFVGLLLVSVTAWAGEISIDDAWVREAPPNARVLGGYMKIRNNADNDDALVKASSEDFGRVEMHRMIMEGGMSRMKPQDKIIVPAVGEVVLEPGGYHLMLIKPKRALKAGDSIELELEFASGQRIEQRFDIRKASGEAMDHSGHH